MECYLEGTYDEIQNCHLAALEERLQDGEIREIEMQV